MDGAKRFNFKLLLPPRFQAGQVSDVRQQEVVDDCDVPKMNVVQPLEREESNQGEIYSKLFAEVEKIQCWKVRVESEMVQKDRRCQENKRTIETQRKVIQELQFGNESLSTKLEEQIRENEDLRNKDDATRKLCHLLKDTFQHSMKKMRLFESEREETHHLFMENGANIQRRIAAFDKLRVQVESERHEMQKVKEISLQFEDLKEKFEKEYNMKQEAVVVLETKMKDKENELQKILLTLNETQERCKELEESTNQHYALVQCSKKEQNSLLEKLQCKEQLWTDAEKNREAIAKQLAKIKEDYALIILQKDSSLEEVNKVKDQQADKLVEIQASAKELQNSLTSEMQRSSELKLEVTTINAELKKKIALFVEALMGKIEVMEFRVEELAADLSRKSEEAQLFKNDTEQVSAEKNVLEKALEVKVKEIESQLSVELKKKESDFQMKKRDIEQYEVKYQELLSSLSKVQSEKNAIQDQIAEGSSNAKALEEDLKCEHLQDEMKKKEKQIKTVESKLSNLETRFDTKAKAQEECLKGLLVVHPQNKVLKKQMEKEIERSSKLEQEISNLKEESDKVRKQSEEEHRLLLENLMAKSSFATELQNEVQKLKVKTAEAVKNVEDADLGCQNKIAEMVVLMEKHKSQYEQMVEEKDAELNETKRKVEAALSRTTSVELELSEKKNENERLRKELTKEMTKKTNSKEVFCLEPPKETPTVRDIFDKTNIRTQSSNTPARPAAPKTNSYRVRTPPSVEMSVPWKENTLELDPKSDSSEPHDLLINTMHLSNARKRNKIPFLKNCNKNREAIAKQLAKIKEDYALIILQKDSSLEEVNKVKDQQADKLVEIQASAKELQNSLTSEMQRSSELKLEVTTINAELKKKIALFVEALMGKIEVMEFRVEELAADLSRKSEEAQLFKNDTEQVSAEKNVLEKALEVKVKEIESRLSVELKKKESDFQMKKRDIEQVKYQELLSSLSKVQSEKNAIQDQIAKGSSNAKALEEDLKCEHLQDEMKKKEKRIKTVESKLSNLKTRFDTKAKAQEECLKGLLVVHPQNKVLKKQMEKEIERSSKLEQEIRNLKEESDKVRKQSEEEHRLLLENLMAKSSFATELQNEVQKLKVKIAEAVKNVEDADLGCQNKIAEMVVLMEKHKSQYEQMVEEKDAELNETKRKVEAALSRTTSVELELSEKKNENERLRKEMTKKTNSKEVFCLEPPKETPTVRDIFDKTNIRTQSSNTPARPAAPKTNSYRVRTPPSVEMSVPWKENTLELDPKSDSSEPHDLLSPAFLKSPGSSVKLAAMKRIREAGWTAITRSKKKRCAEKMSV
ncbi:synaptonemal complex protein 1 [Lampris incognitus]|uniref:synaptonemal complex protein 1 n=1 Tax=Lampris incognitus TaxID=2546036 RepID=UPI0024B4AC62|nr:synaptonemal complex protein 1 [Lampris incognitus]